IGPDATNNVGQYHTFTVTVKQNLGTTGAAYSAATIGHVDVTLTTTAGSAVASVDTANSTCDDAGNNLDSNGQCTIKFPSANPGTIKGQAKVTIPKAVFPGLAADLVRETDGTSTDPPGFTPGQNSGDATKIFLAGSISWTKVDNTGTLQGGAT